MPRRPLAFGATIAVCMTVIAVAAGLLLSLPLRDPDSMVGPGYVRLPAFLAVVFAGDVVVRGCVLRRQPQLQELRPVPR